MNDIWNQYKLKVMSWGYDSENADDYLYYASNNPMVWKKYREQVNKLIEQGAKRISSKYIFEILRTDPELNVNGQFKLQNNYTPHYARMFVDKYPQHADKFVFKKCK